MILLAAWLLDPALVFLAPWPLPPVIPFSQTLSDNIKA